MKNGHDTQSTEESKPDKKPVRRCSVCGAAIKTSVIRQCEKCCRSRKGL